MPPATTIAQYMISRIVETSYDLRSSGVLRYCGKRGGPGCSDSFPGLLSGTLRG
jgi:hypothetical protein